MDDLPLVIVKILKYSDWGCQTLVFFFENYYYFDKICGT